MRSVCAPRDKNLVLIPLFPVEQCSGKNPCTNCERKGKACTFAATDTDAEGPIIIVEGGSLGKTATFAVARRAAAAAAMRQSATPRASPTVDDERYFYYFEVFAQRNDFNGKNRLFTHDIKQLSELQTSPYFLNSIRALGALQASKLLPPNRTAGSLGNTYTSYALYSQAVIGLRKSLDRHQNKMSQSNRTALLWTTLFLGMFELMSETSEVGWLQHMIHGTAKGLAAVGPSICNSPAGARMFQQAKIFEVCRAIVFNDRSFLTRPEWMTASRSLWTNESLADEWRPLDSLIDIMMMCPDLRFRANQFCNAEDECPSSGVPQEAMEIAAEGCALRNALNVWHSTYFEPRGYDEEGPPSPGMHIDTVEDECALLTNVFWSSISIYLSGEFDYELHHWNRFGLIVPTLDRQTVATHVENIMEMAEYALQKTSLSPLMFLFPLRIAGVRSAMASKAQRERILRIIDMVADRFAIGHAIRAGLVDAWIGMGVPDG